MIFEWFDVLLMLAGPVFESCSIGELQVSLLCFFLQLSTFFPHRIPFLCRCFLALLTKWKHKISLTTPNSCFAACHFGACQDFHLSSLVLLLLCARLPCPV